METTKEKVVSVDESIKLYDGFHRSNYKFISIPKEKAKEHKEKIVVRATYTIDPERFIKVLKETKKNKKGKTLNIWANLRNDTDHIVLDIMNEMSKRKSNISGVKVMQRMITVEASAVLQDGDTFDLEKGKNIAIVKADLKAMKMATIIAREAIKACTDAVYVYRDFQSEVELRMAGLADQLEIIKGNVEKEE